MDETTKIIQDFYDAGVQVEWNRIVGRPEFLLTCRMLDRYIKSGDRVLDIGGGPGRYSLYLAEKGCDVTLFDLSSANTKFATERAFEQGLNIKTITGDAREVDKFIHKQFDHVLLMGPMYHLFDESDRISAVNASLNLLKQNGIIFVSFLNMFAGIIYYMKELPRISDDPGGDLYVKKVIEGKSFGSDAFTKAYFMDLREIVPFMTQFPLKKLHYFGQEGITAPCEFNIMAQDSATINSWLDLSEALFEREEFLSYSEHLMYVGRKT